MEKEKSKFPFVKAPSHPDAPSNPQATQLPPLQLPSSLPSCLVLLPLLHDSPLNLLLHPNNKRLARFALHLLGRHSRALASLEADEAAKTAAFVFRDNGWVREVGVWRIVGGFSVAAAAVVVAKRSVVEGDGVPESGGGLATALAAPEMTVLAG